MLTHRTGGGLDAITSRYALEDISQGYQDLDDGKNIRGIIEHGR